MAARKLALTLFTRRFCGLCDEAKVAAADVAQRITNMAITEIDIDAQEHRRKWIKYTYDVPVIHLNGEEIMRHHIDSQSLEKAIRLAMMKQSNPATP
ncbi:hypothetical protein BJ742DRAFT_776482 [Cladochytrium replicatum]|nr:hypothetical protein BJ742DRAFT_776482 [Cladochytrium replicatum]